MAQFLLEQGHGPARSGVAAPLGRAGEEFAEQGAGVLGPQAGAALARLVAKGARIVLPTVVAEPVVDGPACHTEGAGDGGNGFTCADLEDGEGTAVHAGVARLVELPL